MTKVFRSILSKFRTGQGNSSVVIITKSNLNRAFRGRASACRNLDRADRPRYAGILPADLRRAGHGHERAGRLRTQATFELIYAPVRLINSGGPPEMFRRRP